MNESEQKQNQSTQMDELNKSLSTSDDYKGYVFIVPLSAPLPQEIASDSVSVGSLQERLTPLDNKETAGDYELVALSGTELLALAMPWSMLVQAKKVAVLTDLPAAQYDVVFSQAWKSIGIQTISWPSIETSISAQSIVDQRTKDRTPWKASDSITNEDLSQPSDSSLSTESLSPPEASDEEELYDE